MSQCPTGRSASVYWRTPILDRFYSYDFCDPVPFAVRDYQATLRVTPITEGDRAFVEWLATFDCAENERDRWVEQFERSGFATWLGSLRSQLEL